MNGTESLMPESKLLSLPNELLLQIFGSLSTRQLLHLSSTSRRLLDLILRIYKNRITVAACVSDHNLLLECYHPSARLTEPPLHCAYIGTDGLYELSQSSRDVPASQKYKELNGLYSRFRPYRRRSNGLRRQHPAGDIPGSRTHPDTPSVADVSSRKERQGGEDAVDLVTQHIHLDTGELFTQLCTVSQLVKPTTKNGVFFSTVEVADGIIRVWRNWLAEQSLNTGFAQQDEELEQLSLDPDLAGNKDKGKGRTASASYSDTCQRNGDIEEGVLWVSYRKDVGIRFGVRDIKWRRALPILYSKDEEVPVEYQITYEELLVRTRHLLQATEDSLLEQQNVSGKALVFGTWIR